MKIGLISPRVGFSSNIAGLEEFWYQSDEATVYRKYWSGVGSSLLTIAGLTPAGHEIDFVDESYDPVDFSRDYDLVGITAMTQQVTRAYEIADEFRRRGTKVVIGGLHATVLPDEAKQHADSVVIAEAEYLWRSLLEDFENDRLEPFYKSDRVVDLKDSPIPRYDLLTARHYDTVCVQTSRGCPHDCEYCSASKVFGPKYRHKSIEQVSKEIAFIKQHLGNKRIFFSDDNFLVDNRFSTALLERITELDMKWYCQCDISVGNKPELLKLLRRSGCLYMFIGLESLSEDGLRNIDTRGWKVRQLKNYSRYIQAIQSHGIGVVAAFMVGLDSDDQAVFERIGDFAEDNHMFATSVTILTPAPGTRLRERLAKEGRLLPADWNKYTGYNVNHIPKRMSVAELETGLANLYKRIYSKEAFLRDHKHFKEIQRKLKMEAVGKPGDAAGHKNRCST